MDANSSSIVKSESISCDLLRKCGDTLQNMGRDTRKNRERYKRDLVRNKIPLSSGLAFKILLAMDRTRIQVVERIFSANSVKYPAVVLETFLSALLKLARVEISERRTESLWTLAKATDVASVNLSRLSRLEETDLPVLSAHLAVACDVRPDVSMRDQRVETDEA